MRWMLLLMVVGLSACHHQPDFDEKFRQQQGQAAQAASSMEQELQTRLDASSAAGHAP